jgi:hypothetical protein
VLRAVLDWWDGVELWLTQLAFPLQVLLAVLVLLPGCWFAAALVDRVVDGVVAAWAARRSREAEADRSRSAGSVR